MFRKNHSKHFTFYILYFNLYSIPQVQFIFKINKKMVKNSIHISIQSSTFQLSHFVFPNIKFSSRLI